jgi:hypothetical protein
MPWQLAAGIGGLVLTLILTYTTLVRAVSRLEMKVDLLWEWFRASPYKDQLPMRRRHDDWPRRPRGVLEIFRHNAESPIRPSDH